MRIKNLNFGLHTDGADRVVWTWYEFNKCAGGCLIWDFGPFYFTILRGECNIYE